MTDIPTEAAPATKRRILTDAEKFTAFGLLKEHLRPATDGFAYADGWSDQLIATTVGCSLSNIVGLRERNFGRLAKNVAIVTDPRTDQLVLNFNTLLTRIEAGALNNNGDLHIGETN